MGQVVAGNIAVNNSPGKLHCDAVIFAVCCNWNSRGARQVKVYLRIVSENCSSLTLWYGYHQRENTGSRLFTEVKPCWTGLISGWVTI